ncbi:MAG: hypothetical protein IIB36_14550 [Gemmatimonadetes bacterium]|nr:hypothetical protein [Gemmatimonadota bacterium]
MRLTRTLIGIAVAACLFGQSADGQVFAADETALAGISAVDPKLLVTWDAQITANGGRESQYTMNVMDAFELGLLRAGVTVSGDGRFLRCSVQLQYREISTSSSIVAYSVSTNLHELIGAPEQMQWAITWDVNALGTVGIDELDGASVGRWCAETFELDWRRANQGGRGLAVEPVQ